MNMQYERSRFNPGAQRLVWLVLGALFLAYGIVRLGPERLVATLLALLLAITVHECAHAWAADRLGDPTGRLAGRVSLNPLVHLDPMGTAMMLVTTVTGMGIGWGKPVPVAPWRFRVGARLGHGLVALSGPASNLVTAALFGFLLRLAPTMPRLPYLLVNGLVWINIFLAMFNLLPLPPLDGHAVLVGLLSLSRSRIAWRAAQALESLARYGAMPLIVLLVLTQFVGINLLGWLLLPPATLFYRAFVGA